MRIVRIGIVVPAFVSLLALWAPSAQGGDGHCGCTPCGTGPVYTSRGPAGRACHTTVARSWRDPCHPSTRHVIPRYRRGARRRGCGHGTPWSVLRRHLPGYGASPEFRRAYVRSFFLRRYPFCKAEDDGIERMDVLLAQAKLEPEAQSKLPPEGRLHLGMARFHSTDYAGARADFEAVIAARPQDARPRFGLLLCSLCTSQWTRAAGELDVLARRGELRADDRLDAEGCFRDPAVLDAVVEGLRGYARYEISDGDAWLVAAWALAARGEQAEARTCARLARRWTASGAALAALEQNLGLGEPPEPKPATTAPPPAPQPPPLAEVIAKR